MQIQKAKSKENKRREPVALMTLMAAADGWMRATYVRFAVVVVVIMIYSFFLILHLYMHT